MPKIKSSISTGGELSLDNICELVSVSYKSDAIGQQSETRTLRRVFCAELPIHSSEYRVQEIQGIKPEKAIAIDREEYDGQPEVVFGGADYRVYRKYPRSSLLELYLTKNAVQRE